MTSRKVHHPKSRSAAVLAGALLALLLATACGGSEKKSDPGLSDMADASRFLSQATLGANYEEIERVADMGTSAWIDEQIALPPSYHLPHLIDIEDEFANRDLVEDFTNSPLFRRFAWWERKLQAPDVLRQRVALALSEIFVISDQNDLLSLWPHAMASYYDVLVEHAFGNYEELLLDVSLHPAMGIYLSHLNNNRSDEDLGRFPDENYAREVMQLFSIGLEELKSSGKRRRDDDDNAIPTYTNQEITELAKVFTGLGLQGPGAFFGGYSGDVTLPMVMYEDNHEPGPKVLLKGFTLPAGQTGMEDVEDAVGHLADHPNVGPFIALRLIQRLVTSNPSRSYIKRIAKVFANDGNGQRGNLGEVVRAILMDKEARDFKRGDKEAGFLREPFLRWLSFLRTFDASSSSDRFLIYDFGVGFLLGQTPMSSPSVFNFFQPDFAPNGPIRDKDLVAPEFQITNASTTAFIANLTTFFAFVQPAIVADIALLKPDSVTAEDLEVRIDLSDEEALAEDPEALVDRLDLLLTYETMSEETRDAILEAIEDFPVEFRTALALQLVLMSPDYSVIN